MRLIKSARRDRDLVISFFGSLWVMDWVSPRGGVPGGGTKACACAIAAAAARLARLDDDWRR